MSQKHLSQEILDKYVSGKIHGKKLDSVRRHLAQCEACEKEAEQYKLIVHAMKGAEIYEPGDDFVQQVTADLPDLYAPREKPVLEIVSLALIFISFSIGIGVLISSNSVTGIFSPLFTRLFQGIQSFFSQVGLFRMLGENMDILGMAVVYFSLYKLFDRFVLQSKTKRQNS